MRFQTFLVVAIAAVLAVACAREDYHASFTAIVSSKPRASAPSPMLYDPPDAATYAQILVATSFWSKYVEPRLDAGMDKAKIRAGCGIIAKKVGSAGESDTFEFRISLNTGGEPAFEAIKSGFLAYLTEGARPGDVSGIVSVEKPK
jgi:hypothetical protein